MTIRMRGAMSPLPHGVVLNTAEELVALVTLSPPCRQETEEPGSRS
jgi:hypothetical protein